LNQLQHTVSLSDDLAPWALLVTLGLVLASLLLLVLEARRQARELRWLVVSGVMAAVCVAGAVCRPVIVQAKVAPFGPRVVALIDDSRRGLLPVGQGTRKALAAQAVAELGRHFEGARVATLAFSDGELRPFDEKGRGDGATSDLVSALGSVVRAPGERPAAIVVVSDGRWARPLEGTSEAALRDLLGAGSIPVHGVSILNEAPMDASIRHVQAAGAAVAHQALPITVEVGCAGGLQCDKVPVTVRELLSGEPPLTLASGVVAVSDGVGKIEVNVTLDRAGSRVVEVAIAHQEGDVIAENDRRYLTFSVAKERVRLLHLAGRPTYDVRALRAWLKSDEAVDTVAFFILRGETDNPEASDQDLALIRFPVDELFTQHLPSFDAIILQDIDAIRYKLDQYLPRLAAYVKHGGGLIMVGGPSSFAGGNYAGTPLDGVLPVEQPFGDKTSDSEEFVPEPTEAGRSAPVTRNVRSLLDNRLPEVAGANRLGLAKSGSIVLWEHPKLRVDDKPMPVLAIGESGDGRAIALGLDSTYRLAFGELAATAGGRAYGALWDGLLGWLMRDPRYEAARVDLLGECIANEPATLRIQRLPGMSGAISLNVEALTPSKQPSYAQAVEVDSRGTIDVPLRPLPAGGYTARVTVGAAPATRYDFGCEGGGIAWTDTRPDVERVKAVAAATNGKFVDLEHITDLPVPRLSNITAERHTSPLLPAWVWTLLSAVCLGTHWVLRRQGGLA
jgi:uncharacterized membrane protein